MSKDEKTKTKREFNPNAKRYIREKRDNAINWCKENKDSLDAATSVFKLIASIGGVGGLAHKVKKGVSKTDE